MNYYFMDIFLEGKEVLFYSIVGIIAFLIVLHFVLGFLYTKKN